MLSYVAQIRAIVVALYCDIYVEACNLAMNYCGGLILDMVWVQRGTDDDFCIGVIYFISCIMYFRDRCTNFDPETSFWFINGDQWQVWDLASMMSSRFRNGDLGWVPGLKILCVDCITYILALVNDDYYGWLYVWWLSKLSLMFYTPLEFMKVFSHPVCFCVVLYPCGTNTQVKEP